MKAWVLEDSTNGDKGFSLVFADTRSGAKKQANKDNGLIYQPCLDVDSYVDIRATRASYADDKENLKEDDLANPKWLVVYYWQ
ncbi:hypothetical protein DOK67_0000159 [Enterococcus sp. DIV0212c]|uniref:hypothetical protein n=1 Tax=Enterococcus sp. DIV0212c TaxID=2230867 RepID=UPI001A9B4309|nr:hypothetical protein [Enterococcus sp. DIV0212c]MBO1354009.1 hypothetical protein [Enterococcus sp. DIV0212c]